MRRAARRRPTVTLRLSDADGEVSEDAGAVTVRAAVSPASATAFTVTVSASPVAPATDDDFELSASRVLSFARNATESTGTVTIRIVDDDEREPDEVVTVSGAVSNAAIPDPDDVTLTILDDDAGPPPTITSALVASRAAVGEHLPLGRDDRVHGDLQRAGAGDGPAGARGRSRRSRGNVGEHRAGPVLGPLGERGDGPRRPDGPRQPVRALRLHGAAVRPRRRRRPHRGRRAAARLRGRDPERRDRRQGGARPCRPGPADRPPGRRPDDGRRRAGGAGGGGRDQVRRQGRQSAPDAGEREAPADGAGGRLGALRAQARDPARPPRWWCRTTTCTRATPTSPCRGT